MRVLSSSNQPNWVIRLSGGAEGLHRLLGFLPCPGSFRFWRPFQRSRAPRSTEKREESGRRYWLEIGRDDARALRAITDGKLGAARPTDFVRGSRARKELSVFRESLIFFRAAGPRCCKSPGTAWSGPTTSSVGLSPELDLAGLVFSNRLVDFYGFSVRGRPGFEKSFRAWRCAGRFRPCPK